MYINFTPLMSVIWKIYETVTVLVLVLLHCVAL